MAVKSILAQGIGFTPGSIKFIPTLGFTAGAAVVEAVAAATGGWLHRRDIEYLRRMGLSSQRIGHIVEEVAEGAAVLETSRVRIRPGRRDEAEAPLAGFDLFLTALEVEGTQLSDELQQMRDVLKQRRGEADMEMITAMLLIVDEL